MLFFLSLVTSAKDYFEIVHKLIEFHPNYSVIDYNEFGSLISYIVLTIKNFFVEFISLNWLQNVWNLPIIIPDIASAMISEISVLDGFFHNALTFLETPLSYGKQNYSIYGLEKFSIGLINSLFLFLPTSAAHIIMLRRFVFQGIEAGYIAGFGIISGNMFWLASILFGWRFFVIPWLSLDIFRYLLGFIILIKYMWHAANEERRTATLTNLSKSKIFLITFLLALTEQTSLYPFVTNMSISAESTILETFPVDNFAQFIFIHSAYLFGIFAGSLSLLHFTCWLWENPIYKLYIWFISNSSLPFNLTKGPKTNYYKYLNFIFLYLTMICTISSIPYFGLDYTLTNPLGFISDDRILYQINKKTNQPELPETSFLNTQASDRNTRDSRGRHGRRERWKDRLIKYRGMDTALYDQSIYDLFTIEDLNYGFDKFWLRRKIKNHHSRFRMVIFQPWLLSLKKQLAKPRLISNDGVRVELFRMLYEQFYHPNFHAYLSTQKKKQSSNILETEQGVAGQILQVRSNGASGSTQQFKKNKITSKEKSNIFLLTNLKFQENQLKKQNLLLKKNFSNKTILTTSALRKFVRKINTRIKSAEILFNKKNTTKSIYSKNSQDIFSSILTKMPDFTSKLNLNMNQLNISKNYTNQNYLVKDKFSNIAKTKNLSYASNILRYKTFLKTNNSKIVSSTKSSNAEHNAKMMLHPIKFYLQKEKALKRKWKFYGANIFRKLSIENNAPYFRIMMKRLFYYYKPTLRWTNTLKLAKNKQGHKVRKKKSRNPLIYTSARETSTMYANLANTNKMTEKSQNNFIDTQSNISSDNFPSVIALKNPTHQYRVVGKNASRYRYQIYKDVLQHWYYTPFNRLLLKFDIDSFIRRQPKSHFLTKNEEQELHLKRYLLAEHYETLRWYTYMQHYRSMKTNIGGTKSFASRMYNHQFQGTFKKIRHLFAITPQFSSNSIDGIQLNTNVNQVLKFDQPLFNEYLNTEKKSFIKNSVIHEELFSNQQFIEESSNNVSFAKQINKRSLNDKISETKIDSKTNENNKLLLNNTKEMSPNNFTGNDIITQSTLIIKEYLKNAKEKRTETIKNLLLNKNYKEFTKFMFTGQKTRGFKPITNQYFFNNQEKEYLKLTNSINNIENKKNNLKFPIQSNSKTNNFFFNFKKEISDLDSKNITNFGSLQLDSKQKLNVKKEQDLWFAFLKNYKKGFYDQEFLTKFLERRIKKKEKRQQKKEKELKNRLKRLKIWLAPNLQNQVALTKNDLLTTGLKNAIKDGMLNITEKNQDSLSQSINLLFSDKESQGIYKKITNNVDNQNSLNSISSIIEKLNNEKSENKNLLSNSQKLIYTTYLKSKILSQIIALKLNDIIKLSYKTTTKTLLKPFLNKDELLTWDIKDKMLKKRKRSRKKYTKEIKKAQTTLINTLKEQKTSALKNSSDSINVVSLSKLKENESPIFFDVNNNLTNQKQRFYLTQIQKESKKFNNPNFQLRSNTKNTDSIRSINKRSLNDTKDFNNNNLASNFYTISLFNKKPNQKNGTKANETPLSLKNFTNLQDSVLLEKRKKKLSDNEIIKTNLTKFDKLTLNKKESDFLYINTLYGKKFEIKQKFRRKKTKNRRNQRYGRPHHRVEHPSFNANLERKSANMVPEKRLQLLKEQAEFNYGTKNFSNNQLRKTKFHYNIGLLPKKRKSKKRNWKKYKKGINNEKLRKVRKQSRQASIYDTITTQRTNLITKQIKRIKLKLKLQEWWWKQFLPSYAKTLSETNWKLEKERQLEKTISKLSKSEILERDLKNSSNFKQELQIGDYDFKPLALPQALRISDNLIKKNEIDSNKDMTNIQQPFLKETLISNKPFLLPTNPLPFYAGWDESLRKFVVTNRLLSRREAGYSMYAYSTKLTNSINNTTNLIMNKNSLESENKVFLKKQSFLEKNQIEFTNSPLQGMNAGTTLYCQVPFTTFDPDQLFSKGMDGFAPIGWRRFDFTHTIFKTQSLLKQAALNDRKPWLEGDTLNSMKDWDSTNSANLKPLIIQKNFFSKLNNKNKKINFKQLRSFEFQEQASFKNESLKKYTNYSRRLKKHYKRIKKLQNQGAAPLPVFLISGPLINEVLPIHYINVFNKQNRLSRDRYIKRRLRRGKKGVSKAIKEFASKNVYNSKINAFNNKSDFTLRRRIKTKRKYHRKPYATKGIEIRPRRHKFFTEFNTKLILNNEQSIKITSIPKTSLRKRPSKRKLKKNRQTSFSDQDGTLSTKNRQRQKLQKTGALSTRLRQLRRRVSRQVLKTVPRRRPRAGGFIWPGDYLRLEQTESPKLILKNNIALNNLTSKDINKQKIPRKIEKKSILLDLYVQPRKYLLEQHNIKVIKKKLEKAQLS